MRKIFIYTSLFFLLLSGCSAFGFSTQEDVGEEVAPLTVSSSDDSIVAESKSEPDYRSDEQTADSNAMLAADRESNNMASGGNMMMSPSSENNGLNSTSMSGSPDVDAIPEMPKLEIPTITNFPFDDIESDEVRQAVELLVTDPDLALLLDQTGEWQLEGWYDEGEMTAGVDFFDANYEWIGWGAVEFMGGDEIEIQEVYAPRELTSAEYQAGMAAVEFLVLNHAEVQGLLGNANDWERYTDYDRWEKAWFVTFEKGLDSIAVLVHYWDEQFVIDDIYDPAALSEEERLHMQQDRAIEIAYGAEGVDSAVYGAADNWKTIVTELSGSRYGVSFVSDGEELFFAEVNIESGEVVSTAQ